MKKGIKAENRVAALLRRAGARVKQSPGSKTSADIEAKWDSGKKWLVQVKYSGKGRPSSLNSNERKALLARAKRNNATAVLAEVTSDKIKFISLHTGRRLKP